MWKHHYYSFTDITAMYSVHLLELYTSQIHVKLICDDLVIHTYIRFTI